MIVQNVTREKLETLRAKLISTHQTQVSGTTNGAISGHGVTAWYRYDEAAQTLSVDVQHHPFFIPVSAIESQLRQALGA